MHDVRLGSCPQTASIHNHSCMSRGGDREGAAVLSFEPGTSRRQHSCAEQSYKSPHCIMTLPTLFSGCVSFKLLSLIKGLKLYKNMAPPHLDIDPRPGHVQKPPPGRVKEERRGVVAGSWKRCWKGSNILLETALMNNRQTSRLSNM